MSARVLPPVWNEHCRSEALARIVELLAVVSSTHWWTPDHRAAKAEIASLSERLGLPTH
jgi:hypothetical protein